MKDEHSAKTRIQGSGTGSEPDDGGQSAADQVADNAAGGEKTRVAPVSKPTAAEPDEAASPAAQNKPEPGDAKTRIAPVKKQAPPDATRFKPKSAAGGDRTRLAPSKRPGPAAEGERVETTTDTQADLHILKNRFVLEEVLGTGGMGIVYKAKDLLMEEAQDRDPYVAIKVLNEEFKTHPEAFISLQRESRKSQRIAHPNIVNVYDFDRDDETVFMTMEYLDGDPLDELISRYQSTGLPTDEAWEIIAAMTSALAHAHAERIIHSDFKPGNVFVTKKGLTKVFDFGIARAVARVEHIDDTPTDMTLFDAGNLGALTPAYASLEMLEGEEPDVRDDIYALGCVAYEMLTGEHPYHKVPADEAERQRLKPKRITNIKGSQWRAIEKAIAFRRENRLASVKEFGADILPQRKSLNWLVPGLALIFVLVITGYLMIFQKQTEDSRFSEFDIRNEIELQVKIDFYKSEVETLLQDPIFSNSWQSSLWQGISDLTILTKGGDAWVNEKKQVIYQLYLRQIEARIEANRYGDAEELITNAQRYTEDDSELAGILEEIGVAMKKYQGQQAQLAAQKKQKEQQQKALKKQQYLEKQARQTEIAEQQKQKTERKEQFELALENVNNQLKCQASLNMGNLETAIGKLKQLDKVHYRALEQDIINSLASCIVQIGKAFPERAHAAKKHSLRIFKSSTLAKVTIKSRDPCDKNLAGLGARGKRTICKDKLKDKTTGPDMVVIPGSSKLLPFAIGKYEVSVAQINHYCKTSKACKPLKQNEQAPASNIPVSLAKSYLKWLSQQTGKTYRLPVKEEWVHAAKSRAKKLDPNRNCELQTRGFKKGEELVKFSVGKQNGWGLVNYVGNVQEWVYHTGRRLQAVGGSFQEPMGSCTITTSTAHDGSADIMTGFRVLREVEG